MISFENFSYKNLFLDVNFSTVDELIFLTGDNGSGKSTLAYLLLGLKSDYSGDIFIGGKNIKEYSKEDLNATVKLYKRNVDELIYCECASEYYQMLDIIKMPYDRIDIDDITLSKKILFKILATTKNAKVIILDEVAHKLDFADFNNLKKYCEGKVLIIITNHYKITNGRGYEIKDKSIKKIGAVRTFYNYKRAEFKFDRVLDSSILDHVYYLNFSSLLSKDEIEEFNFDDNILSRSVHKLSTGEHIILRLLVIFKNDNNYHIDGLLDFLDDGNKDTLLLNISNITFSIYGETYEK